MSSPGARRDSLYIMLLGAIIFVLFGTVLMMGNRVPALDFRTAYYCGACLLQPRCDPYNSREIEALYSQKVERFPVPERSRPVITHNIYLPSVDVFVVPLAMIPFGMGQALWIFSITSSFVIACLLMWRASIDRIPVLGSMLLGFCLANSASLLYFGNPAGFVVPLCVIGAWCFVEDRYQWLGIACFAVSLAFKPHDSGLVWLYFLLAGRGFRKKALLTFALVLAFTLPAVLWATHLSPNWLQEIGEHLRLFSQKGGMNDPSAEHGTLVLTNLQTITSAFLSDPESYDRAAYMILAPLVLWWAWASLKARPTKQNAWMALAAAACFSMLPMYHRQYDSKLIVLAIPALALVWRERTALRWIAAAVTTLAIVLNGDIPWIIFEGVMKATGLQSRIGTSFWLKAVWDFPVPLSLLAMGTFYLWMLWRKTAAEALATPTAGSISESLRCV